MSLKRQRQLTLKRPDDMLKPPEWLRRPPETFLNVLRLLQLVLKKPDVWLRMHEDLKAIQDRKVMLVLVVKQVRRVRVGRKVSRESADLRAYRARKVIQENGDLRECRGQLAQQGHLAHVVRPGHREQWGRVVKPGPEAKKETRGGLRDQRGMLVREVSRGRKVTPAHVERPDHPDHRVRQGKPARKGIKVNPAQQVRQVPQALGEKPAPQVLRVPQAVSPVFRMPAHHRKVLYS